MIGVIENLVGEYFAVDRAQVGDSEEWREEEDVVEPPADDGEHDAGVTNVGKHRHVEHIADADHHAHPAGDDHPLMTPPLHLQKSDRRSDPHGEDREYQPDFPGFLARTRCAAEPQLVVMPEEASINKVD